MILVTGGTGYIGSHTVVELVLNGEKVIIFDNLSNSDVKVVDFIEKITGNRPIFIKGDILNLVDLEKVFLENKITEVVHFAGLKAVGESVQKPILYNETNITGTINILKMMEKYDVNKIVFSSSATVYGEKNVAPFSEKMQTDATNPYGYTKFYIEKMLADVAVSNENFTAIALRYFNPIGAHKSGLIGENPKGIPNNLLPYIMKVISGELEYLSVFGDDYDTIDGTGVRDYIHVSDIALGHVKALEYARKNTGYEHINLGTGKGYSVLEVVKACEKASDKKVSIKIGKRREGDIAKSYAKSEKAKELLGWKATKTLDEMCDDSFKYICGRTK